MFGQAWVDRAKIADDDGAVGRERIGKEWRLHASGSTLAKE